MKKIKKIFLTMLLILLSITTVKAKEDFFEKSWHKELVNKSNDVERVGLTSKISFGEGYVVSNSESEGTKLSYYNNKGETIKEIELNKQIVATLKEYDGAIYAVTFGETDDSYQLIKLNSNLEIIASESVYVESKNFSIITIVSCFVKYAGIDFISTVDGRITVLSAQGNDAALHHFDKDLKNHELKIITGEEKDLRYTAKYYPIVTDFFNIVENDKAPDKIRIFSDKKDNLQIYNGADLTKCEALFEGIEDENNLPTCYINSSLKLTENNDVLFDKTYDDYLVLIDAKFIGNYIVAIGIRNVGDIIDILQKGDAGKIEEIAINIQSDIVILNKSGEIVQTIGNKNNLYAGITPSNNGFMVYKGEVNVPILDIITGNLEEEAYFNLYAEAYDILREINTKVIGKGDISITNKSKSGEKVTYSVTPKKGYSLSHIKITDADGNTVEINENSFIMPSSDVTIEVTFNPTNPETKDIAIIGTIITMLIVLGLTIHNYKKVNFLR